MLKRAQRRRAHPARPYVVSILILSALALLSVIADSFKKYGLQSTLVQRDVVTLLTGDEQCRQVHGAKDQCAFINANCPDEEAGLFSYLTLYYCRLPEAKPLGFIIIVLWTGFLFSTIGVAASDFFCVNLSTISNILGMSESFAGVTFLAFGNGSPDVFSTFAAIKSHSGSLAIGELIGAAGFITAVVSGSMAIVRPFKVAKKSFVRDVVFFIVATSFSMVFLANGSLALWECAVMVGFYVFYVGTVVCWHWWLGRRRKRRETEAAARAHYLAPDEEETLIADPYADEDENNAGYFNANGVSADDFNDLERAEYVDPENIDEDEEEVEHDKWLGELNSNMRINKGPDGERRSVFNPIRPSLVGALEFQAVLANLQKSQSSQAMPLNARRYSDAQEILTNRHRRSYSTFSVTGIEATKPELVAVDDTYCSVADVNEDRIASGRGRAATVNDAARPQFRSLNQDKEPTTHDELINLSHQGEREEEEETQTHDSSIEPMDAAKKSPSSGLDSGSGTVRRHAAGRPRASTGNYLTIPEDASTQRQRGISLSIPEALRAGLRLPSRSPSYNNSQPNSRRASPRNSPLQTPHSGHESYRVLTPPALALPPPSPSPELDFPPEDLETDVIRPVTWWPQTVLPLPDMIIRTLFPTLYGWSDKGWWEKLLGIAAAPSFLLLTITLPVVEGQDPEEAEAKPLEYKSPAASLNHRQLGSTVMNGHDNPIAVGREFNHPHRQNSQNEFSSTTPLLDQDPEDVDDKRDWHRWLVIVQCFTAPLFIVLVFWANTSTDPRDLIRPTLYCLLGSMIALFLLLLTTNPYHPPRWHFLLCFVGFAVSITWISTIANEVVGVLKTIGVIFNMSDAILGLTIFAVGNSLGDLVADITVARLGYPVMALSACFGGPLLNILLGIGLSGLYIIVNGAEKRQHKHPGSSLKFKPYHVQVSTTLLISAVALLVTLVGLLIVVPLNGWRMDRRIGWGLIILWCIATVGNIIVEVAGLSDEF